LSKEGKLNRQFKRRFFVLWRDPDAHAAAEATEDGEVCSLDAAEEPMHLLYYADEHSLPKGIIILIPGDFTVGVPKRARRSLRHCLRIDGTYPVASEEGAGVAAFKYVLADEDVEVIGQWRVKLATRGGIVEDRDEEEAVDIDSVKVIAASTAASRIEFRMTKAGVRTGEMRMTMKDGGKRMTTKDGGMGTASPTGGGLGALGKSQSTDQALGPTRTSSRGRALRKAPSARAIGAAGLEKMLQSPRRRPEPIDFARNDGVEFTFVCTGPDVEDPSGVRTWQFERSFGDLAKLRDALVANPGTNIDAFDNKFPPKRWVPTTLDEGQLIAWCKAVELWIQAALPVCATNRALARFLDEAVEPATGAQ